MGARAQPSTTANTTNTSSSSTSVGDIGFTGQQGVDVFNSLVSGLQSIAGVGSNAVTSGAWAGVNLGQQGATVANNLGNLGYQGLTSLVTAGQVNTAQAYEFGASTVRDSLSVVDRAGARAAETYAGLTNATRDFVQRALAGSTGQQTPIQQLPGATASVPVLSGSTGGNTALIVGAVAVAVIFLLKD